MTSNGKVRIEQLAVTAQVAAALSIARTVTVAIEACEGLEVPLSQTQKMLLIESALLEFDGFDVHLVSLERIWEQLHDPGTETGV